MIEEIIDRKKAMGGGEVVIDQEGDGGNNNNAVIIDENNLLGVNKTQVGVTQFLIENMVEKWPKTSFTIYMDSFYTSVSLFDSMRTKNKKCVGTIRTARIKGLPSFEQPDKGQFIFFKHRRNPNMHLLLYNDTKPIYVLSTHHEPMWMELKQVHPRKNWNLMPYMIDDYNHHTHGVDHCNCETSRYRYPHKVKKWWKVVFFYLIRLAVYNSFVYFQKLKKGTRISMLQFYEAVIKGILPSERLSEEAKGYGHYPEFLDKSL
mmetsp:Transcript_7355/g.6702  ORF Transcript_7355/g.6702 Transcript_7355/m.6702 type:complete len:261 (-) Transcript_7355:513-1295(-)